MIEAIIGRFKTEQEAEHRLEVIAQEDAGFAVEYHIRYNDEEDVWLLSRAALDTADIEHLRLRQLVLYARHVDKLFNAGAWDRAEAYLRAMRTLVDIIDGNVQKRRDNEQTQGEEG